MLLRVCFKWHKKSHWWPLFDNSKYYSLEVEDRDKGTCVERVEALGWQGDAMMMAKNGKMNG